MALQKGSQEGEATDADKLALTWGVSSLQHHFEGCIHWPSSQRAPPCLAFSQRDTACALWDRYQYKVVSRDTVEFPSEAF